MEWLDELEQRLHPPVDWENPNWDVGEKVHNWRNYVSNDAKQIWPDMRVRLRIVLAANFDYIAGQEEWD